MKSDSLERTVVAAVLLLSAAAFPVKAIADAPAAPAAVDSETHPPIAILFTLRTPGYVTLVIEDQSGKRVRNLISETPFPAGQNVAWWDGLDDLGRDTDAASHAVYHVPGQLVSPGTYKVRGLVRPDIHLNYELTPYTNGNPPWRTADRGSEWLANHTAPSAMLFVPAGVAPARDGKPSSSGGQILVGSFVSEGGSGLAWIDEEGHKLFGQMWLGGVWTGASHLAMDQGDHPVPGVYAYAGAGWHGDKYNGNVAELRLHELVGPAQKGAAPHDTRFGTGEDQPVLTPTYKIPAAPPSGPNVALASTGNANPLGGLAVRNGLLVASLPGSNLLVFVDAAAHKELGTASLPSPGGLAFDRQGHLLVLSGSNLLSFQLAADPTQLPAPQTLITGLDHPQQMTLDAAGKIYVSVWGQLHQVEVFDAAGKPAGTIGTPGVPAVGPYDPTKMHYPNGLTIDDHNRLWVAETDKAPKRISVWTLDGQFVKAFYGPQAYGGGGWLDSEDKTRFFYTDEGGGQELKLDWATGSSVPVSIYMRTDTGDFPLAGRYVGVAPQTPIHHAGLTYLTNAFNSSPTSGTRSAEIWLLQNGVARPVAGLGNVLDAAGQLLPAFADPAYKTLLPANYDKVGTLFAWSDANDDGQIQPSEVSFYQPPQGDAKGQIPVDGVTVGSDLAFNVAMAGDSALHFAPLGFTKGGAPLFDATKGAALVTGVQRPSSSGGNQTLTSGDWTIFTTGPAPFASQSMAGAQKGVPLWSYPSLWPGLHASHISPLPDTPGELIGTTRLIGEMVTPQGSDSGPLWAINGNKGNIYLFTTDGLFVATLFKDSRTAAWDAPQATPGMSMDNLSEQEESFWPSLSQTSDGNIYLQVNGSVVSVHGLEGIRRLPSTTLTLTAGQLQAARAYFVQSELARQATQPPAVLTIANLTTPPVVDGQLTGWKGGNWVDIDTRYVQEGNWGRRKSVTQASLAVSGDNLYAMFKTDDPKLLTNSGDSLPNLFKTGGALDLMFDAIPGGERLLVTRVNNKTVAVLYRAHVPGTTTDPVQFASPMRTVKFDRVDDVSAAVTLVIATDKDAKGEITSVNYELSVPLATLGITAAPGATLKGDLGILRGNGFSTLQRVYWSNKATGLVSDVPSEAELQPQLWGKMVFGAGAN